MSQAAGFIGISCSEQSRWADFWASFLSLQHPPNTAIEVARSANIAQNRNLLTRHALDCGAEWIFYVDDDQYFMPDTLLKLLDRNVSVVSGLYLSRSSPFSPVVFDREGADGKVGVRPLAPDDHGLIRVKATGAGALLVRREVLKQLSEPWWTLGQITPDHWSDDIDFCRRVRAEGFSVWCDLDALVGHKLTATIFPQHASDGWVTTFVSGGIQPIAYFPQPQPEGVKV